MKNYFVLAVSAFLGISASSQVVINEIMQSNIDCVMDDLNQFPDSWVEIYNAGNTAVNLSDYTVNDSDDPSTAWQLPSKMLGPQLYQLIYCDKESDNWHTPFRLESGKGCQFFLFKNGEIVDQLPSGMKKQPAPNVAYGRISDGGDKWAYQLAPSPGASNKGGTCSASDILESPLFSVPGKVFRGAQSFSLSLSMPEGSPEGTVIRYTLDGSEPTSSSIRYAGPITINKSTVVRAKPFCDGYLSPQSTAHSYLSFSRDINMPVISVVTDKKYLYDNKLGILVEGTYGNGNNYEYNWRRPMNFEIFDTDMSESCINQLGEARVTGGASRGAALKSLGIYANKRFGQKRFNYEFFPDQRPGITDYKSLMLRNAGNDFDYLYMRDAIIQRHMAQYMDIDWQAYRPAIVFINGEYKGMLNIRERSNEDNIYSNYDGLEDIDMVENLEELKEGNMQEWLDFQEYYNEKGHTYVEYDQKMDVLEYLNVMILNLYYCNLDFPGNNIVHWKPQAEGGRWRVIVKDTDFGIGLYGRNANYQVFKWLYDPNYDRNNNWAVFPEATILFRNLMDDEVFNREFIDRFAIYMGDFMNYERTWETWEPMYDAISQEYPNHRALFNPWWPVYSEELTNAKNWLRARTNNMYNQINDFYKVGAPKSLKISALDNGIGSIESIEFNGVELSRSTFDGKFFVDRPILLNAEGASGWCITEYSSAGAVRTETDGPQLSYAIPQSVSRVEIVALANGADPGEVSEDRELTLFEGEHEIDWWNLALKFGEDTYDDFRGADSMVVGIKLIDQSDSAHFKFQTSNKDWTQTPFPSQAELPGSWTNGSGDIHVVAAQDGTVEIPLNQADKDLIDANSINEIMLVGHNTIVTKVALKYIGSGISDVIVPMTNDGISYNIMGIPVDASYKGVVIRNGKKYLQR